MTRTPTPEQKLASELRRWREKQGISGSAAAKLLGMSLRTYEGVEQGRGFSHATLLRLALVALTTPENAKRPAGVTLRA